MLTEEEIRKHYLNPSVMNTIIRVSTSGNYSRAGAKYTEYLDKEGNTKTSIDWYKGSGSHKQRDHLYKIDLSSKQNYVNAVGYKRTLYWTLNFFDKGIYSLDYKGIGSGVGTTRSAAYTHACTFGIDIDAGKSFDIHTDAKAAVESLAQFYSDKFREYLPNSVYLLYSGGGIYVLIHHSVFENYFKQYQNEPDWLVRLQALYDAFNALIDTLRDEFFKLHPEFEGKVKPDALNSVQRLFKCIYSVHKKLDYAVIPLDPKNVQIDFKKAELPLSASVLEEGNNWYTKFDDGTEFIEKVLQPHLTVAHTKEKKKRESVALLPNIPVSSEPLEDISKWPPCMRNLYNLPTCGEGATRGLAAFAAYLGQIGLDEAKARTLFNELSTRWGTGTEHIFSSYFRKMKVATCTRLRENNNKGFPEGVSLKVLNVCKPDVKCLSIPSPRYYADNRAYKSLVLAGTN